MWRFMYRNRTEKLHWEVLEQDRVVLESWRQTPATMNTCTSTMSASRACAA